jgi:hypothetical protein
VLQLSFFLYLKLRFNPRETMLDRVRRFPNERRENRIGEYCDDRMLAHFFFASPFRRALSMIDQTAPNSPTTEPVTTPISSPNAGLFAMMNPDANVSVCLMMPRTVSFVIEKNPLENDE